MNNLAEHSELASYDLILKHGRVIDPGQSLNGIFDIAVQGDRIAAIAPNIPAEHAKQTIDVQGQLVCPGFIDLHTHVYEWVTDFGLWADDVGIHAGVTTVVDQGSCGPLTFLGFKATAVDRASTDVRCFPSVNLTGALKGGMGTPALHSPEMVDIDALLEMATAYPETVRGFKVHGESGALSRWGTEVLQLARKAADLAILPLYVHTGELFAVIEERRPHPDEVLANVLAFLQPGDLLAHCYSRRPDGLMGTHENAPKILVEAIKDGGIRLDLGHGVNFSFDIARRMMDQGLLPYTVSSDVHGDFAIPHNDATLDYSLCGALSKLMALGLDLETAIATVTLHPARVLQATPDIGTLHVGSRADITVLEQAIGNWTFYDSTQKQLTAEQRLVPTLVVRNGQVFQPHRRLLRDLAAA
ncbi:MAG: amidohydrolase family protein [Leptolyngbya sp. BL-A-14]